MSLAALASLEPAYPTCAECADGLLHCHGTAIEHPGGAQDCLDEAGCRLIPEIHAFLLSCQDVGCGCDPAR